MPGIVIATFLFFPSFVFVLSGTCYIEQERHNHWVQDFLAGASIAIVGVVVMVSIDLAPAALVDVPSVIIASLSFLFIVFLKRDMALFAVGSMRGGITMVMGDFVLIAGEVNSIVKA